MEQVDEDILWWTSVHRDNAVLTLWQGTPVYKKDRDNIISFFQTTFDVGITVVGCVTTLPDRINESDVPDTGGRYDFFFYVDNDDIPKFAVRRIPFVGMRWWEDVYFNDQQSIYPQEFLNAYPCPDTE